MRTHVIAAALAMTLPIQLAQAESCDMALGFAQPDRGGARTIAVWQDAGKKALLFADTMNVNTDSTRRSYSVSDFWGENEKDGAINNLCNAMSDACAGLNPDGLRSRRVLTQRARDAGWPAAMLAQTRISPSIIPFKDGRPCPEVNGFLVSATALHRADIADACDIDNYVDALVTSAIVLPKRSARNQPTAFEQRGARIGDLAAVLSGDGKILKFAVVGDMGPSRELGEVSVALAGALLGKSQAPVNYREIRGREPFKGKGWTVGNTFVLVFPGTRPGSSPYLSQSRIDKDGETALASWGGLSRLRACASSYKPR